MKSLRRLEKWKGIRASGQWCLPRSLFACVCARECVVRTIRIEAFNFKSGTVSNKRKIKNGANLSVDYYSIPK